MSNYTFTNLVPNHTKYLPRKGQGGVVVLSHKNKWTENNSIYFKDEQRIR